MGGITPENVLRHPPVHRNELLARTALLNRWSAATVLQLSEEEAAERLVRLRGAGYLVVRGRGRAASYTLRRDVAERLRGKPTLDAEVPLEEEAVKLRAEALLAERGRLTNADIRRFSGFSRVQVYRLAKEVPCTECLRIAHHRGRRMTPRPNGPELIQPGKYDHQGNLRPVERTILPFQVAETKRAASVLRRK